MKLTMLGTGHATVTRCYNTCFLLEDAGQYLLVDGGGGNTIQRQLLAAGCDWTQIHHLVVSHCHLDHVLGIIWMVRLLCQGMRSGKYTGEAWIYSHKDVLELLRDMAERTLSAKYRATIDTRLHLVEVHDGESMELLGHATTFFDMRSVNETQYGFAMDYAPDKRLVFCGDEPCREHLWHYARHCDWLLHEAFCLASEADTFRPHEKQHSTVQDACQRAEELGVCNLVLYHTEDSHMETRKALYTAEGQRFFSGALFVPDDLESLELN